MNKNGNSFGENLEAITNIIGTRFTKNNKSELVDGFRIHIQDLDMEISISWLLNEVAGLDKPNPKSNWAGFSARESARNKIKKLLVLSGAKTYRKSLNISRPLIVGNTIRKSKVKLNFDFIYWV